MRRHPILAVLAALLLTLAACGGDDGGEDIADVASDEADQGPDGDAGDVAGGDERDEKADAGRDSAEDGLAALTNDDCAALYAGIASAASAFGGGTEGEDLTDVAEYYEEIADKVPEEIKADFETFAAAYGEFAKAAADAGVDFSKPETVTPEALQEMGSAAEALNDPEVQEASDRISTFAEETCGAGAGADG